MALQVWLPLNGDLHNLGLSNVTVTNNGATINNSGKIGKCYNFDGSNDFISFSNFNPSEYEEFSLSLWYKANVANDSIFLIRKNDTTHLICLGFNLFFFRDKLNSSLRLISFSGMTTNIWQHISIVYDKGSIYIYLNGTLLESYISQSNTSLNSNLNEIRLGRVQASSYDNFFNGYINDIRIYNHALSPKEVHEIAKGLVLHYKLDLNLNVLNNCYNYPTFNTSNASGGWSHWAPSGSVGSYSLNTDKNFIYNKNNTYSHKVSCISGSYYICFLSPAFEGGYRSAQAIVKMSDEESPSGRVAFSHNANVGVNPSNTFTYLGDGFYLMKHEGFRLDGSNDLVSIYITAGNTIYISEAYLENDREICSDIFGLNDLTTVYDSSGYCNDGTIVGTTTLNLLSPRYDKCLSMNNTGTTNHIEANPIGVSDNIFTVSFWVNAQKSTNQVFVADPRIVIGTLNSLLYVVTTSSAPFTTTNFITGWNHIVVIRNGTTYKAYINGIAETRSGSNNYYAHSVSKLWLLNRSYNTTYAANTSISDFRIYATALSDEDIKELYDTAAIVDNGGNMYGYLFEESIENVELNPPLANFNHTSGSVQFDGKDLVFTGFGSSYSNFIEVDVSKTLTYDITYSNLLGSWFLIGFERYDENKATVSNNGCVYILTTTNAADNKRITGTVTLSAVNGNTCKFTKIRVLNCWTPQSTITGGIGKIHSFHFSLISGDGNSEVTELGQVKTGWFMEDDLLLTLISKNKYITTTQLIEI